MNSAKSGRVGTVLARTEEGKLILVEAKAHIDEPSITKQGLTWCTPQNQGRLDEAKSAFRATKDAFGTPALPNG